MGKGGHRGLTMLPAPWEKERYKEEVRKRNEERLEKRKQQEAAAAKRQKTEAATPMVEEEDDEDEEESEDETDNALGYLDMGTSTGAWPFYLRLMFISGYRYVLSLDADTLPCDKQEVLDAILKCCPSHRRQVKNTFEGSCNNAYHSVYMSMNKRSSPYGGPLERTLGRDRLSFFDPFADMFEAHDYFNEAEIMSAKGRMYLGVVGLDLIAELAFSRLVDFPPPVIRRVGEMFKTLKPFVPQTVEDLAGTPYDTSDECSLDNNGCVQLVEEMIPLFVKAAEFGDCVTEQY